MNFEAFAQAHGLIIKRLISDKWVRCATVDHPHKLNGSYKFSGDVAFLQNWAIHEKPVMWKTDTPYKRDLNKEMAQAQQANKERLEAHRRAANKAAFILKSCSKESHTYLVKKGFAEEKGWVWNNLLIVPMRTIEGNLVGCQMIDKDGTKKFLKGQMTKGVMATFDNKGAHIVTEGYATALSVRRALKAVQTRYTIHVTFSAANLVTVAGMFPDCVVVGDRDITGIKVAQQTGRPAWFSEVDGEDFNDAELRMGAQSAGESLLKTLMGASKDTVS